MPAAGTIIDGTYRLDAVLGAGGMGVVYRAVHLGLQKPVAVKILQAPAGDGAVFFERFRSEAEILGRLSHPAIVRVTDFGVDPRGHGHPYLVMDLIEGPTLDAWCGAAPVPLGRAIAVLEGIASALDAAHEAGVVHGDLTLRNVVVMPEADGGRPIVIDFGLARLAPTEGGETTTRAFLAGTAEFMAPELHRTAPCSTATDVYAYGVLGYRVLTGRFPFSGTRAAIAQAQAGAPPLPSSIVATLRREDFALLPALAASAADRPTRAGDVAAALRRVERGNALATWRRREVPRRTGAALLIAALCALVELVSSDVGVLRWLEGVAFDARVQWSSPRLPDTRLLLVSFDDRSLAADATPLPDRADEVGRVLGRLMSAGPARVGVDLLLPAHWGASRPFADLVLGHAPRLVLAVAQEGGEVVGPESIGGLVAAALGPEASRRLFASVNVEPDVDGVVRSARVARRDGDGAQPTLAARLVDWPEGRGGIGAGEAFPIDYRLDRRRLERVSWIDLERILDAEPDRFRDRVVLVGAEFSGSGDRHLAPHPGGGPADVTGLEQQALIAATLMAPDRLEAPRGWRRVAVVGAVGAATGGVAFAVLVGPGVAWPLAALGAALVLWVLGAFVSFGASLAMPVAAPVAAMLGGFAAAWIWSSRWPPRPPAWAPRGK